MFAYKISRAFRYEKVNKRGYGPIQIIVVFNKQRLRVSTEELVHQEGWDKKLQKVKTDEPYHQRINEKLSDWERRLVNLLEKAKLARQAPTPEVLLQSLKDDLNPPPPVPDALIQNLLKPEPTAKTSDFFTLFQTWIQEKGTKYNKLGNKLDQATITSLEATRLRFLDFQNLKNYHLTLAGMDNKFYDAFQSYVRDDLQQSLNTCSKHISRLKSFLEWCELNDHFVCVKYRKFATPEVYVGVDFLTEQEIKILYNLDFRTEATVNFIKKQFLEEFNYEMNSLMVLQRIQTLEQMRDIFLMSCYTGMRISDLFKLNPTNLHQNLIIYKPGKVEEFNITCYVPYFDDHIFKPVEIIQRYQGQFKTCLPINWEINRYLKTIQQLAKIIRLNLTTKIGRKTFATLKLYQGVPTRIVMQATGHQTEKSFNRYIGVDTFKLIESFKRQSQAAGGWVANGWQMQHD